VVVRVTAAEALSQCVARGVWSRAECQEQVDAQRVAGVYCDGTIVLDARGKRCVPRAVVDRVQDARDGSPLPPRPDEQPSPMTPSPWIYAGAALGLGVLVAGVVWLVRR
jgi:hypothetical protein